MKSYFYLIMSLIIVSSCSSSKKIIYDFESKPVSDSVYVNLKNLCNSNSPLTEKNNLVALLRSNQDGYDIIFNVLVSKEESPLRSIMKKTKRFIKLDNGSLIPLIFDSDILSEEFRKNNIGGINFGGYYLKLIKDNYEYKVIGSGMLY